jgi:hypothetical protein
MPSARKLKQILRSAPKSRTAGAAGAAGSSRGGSSIGLYDAGKYNAKNLIAPKLFVRKIYKLISRINSGLYTIVLKLNYQLK